MILSVTLTGDKALIAKMRTMPSALRQALLLKITKLAIDLEAYIKTNKLNGQVLNRITGALSRSITHDVIATGSAVWAKVFSSGDVKYAGIHEYGGKTQAHVIVPKKASVLAFVNGAGKKIFARRVNHPGSQMPERSFMRSSLREMSTTISFGMKEAAVRGLQQAAA